MQNYAADLNTQPMTYGRIFNDIGGVLVNGGYSGFRIATLKLDEINCGIGEFDNVVEEYGILFSLQDVDEKYISEALIQGNIKKFFVCLHIRIQSFTSFKADLCQYIN